MVDRLDARDNLVVFSINIEIFRLKGQWDGIVHPADCKNQCCGTLPDPDPRIRTPHLRNRIRIRLQILHFLSVANKMPTKNKFLFKVFCFSGYFYINFLLVDADGRIRSITK